MSSALPLREYNGGRMARGLVIDGSMSEGGGQVLRSALTLSLVTGRSFRIEQIRAESERPGLQRQHLAPVRAAQQVSRARVEGAAVGSQELEFEPGAVRPGLFLFDVGSAGSASLVLQTVILPLCLAEAPSDVTVIGGTHGPGAPPAEFLERAYLPLLRRMGPEVVLHLERVGFHPEGGGRLRADVRPAPLEPLYLMERGAVDRIAATIRLAHLPMHVAEREHAVLVRDLRMRPQDAKIVATNDTDGPGNAVVVEARCAQVTEVFTGFGRKGLRGEQLTADVVAEVRAWMDADVPVGPHLADQLLLPLALAGGGRFRTLEPTAHTMSVASVIQDFLPVRIAIEEDGGVAWRVTVSAA